jgi:type IV pilus assembly protein PilM
MRDVSLGCGQINQKIAALIDCTLEEAEAIKFGEGGEKISAEDLSDIISSVVTDWCTEIRRALDFFYSTYPDDQIRKIILGGGGGNIQELRQLLAVETSAEVQTINPFQQFLSGQRQVRHGLFGKNRPPGIHLHGVGHPQSG